MNHPRHSPQRGMTLVELLVAMVIGLGMTLAITSLLIASENHKRTTTSTNDVDQTGSYAFNALNELLRGAGSGVADSAFGIARGLLGCRINAGTFLPRSTAFPAPFSTTFLTGATNTLRLAPMLIAKNQSDAGSDVLVVMNGSGSAGGVARQINGAGSATSLVLQNTVGFSPQDVVLVSQNGVTDCLVEEVSAVSSPDLTLAGTYYTTGTTTQIAAFSASTASWVTPIGNASANNIQFELIGVGNGLTLYTYDLLQNVNLVQGSGGDQSQAIADGVQELHAIYGIANGTNPAVQNTWADPGAVGSYDIATVMNSTTIMQSILAVRVALVLRGEYYDKNVVTPSTLTLFSGYTDLNGNPLQQVINISATNQHYRYRVFEFTVPLRNMLLLAS